MASGITNYLYSGSSHQDGKGKYKKWERTAGGCPIGISNGITRSHCLLPVRHCLSETSNPGKIDLTVTDGSIREKAGKMKGTQ